MSVFYSLAAWRPVGPARSAARATRRAVVPAPPARAPKAPTPPVGRWAHHAAGVLGLLLATVGPANAQTFAPLATYATGPTSGPADIQVADVNGDGRLDLLTANTRSHTAGVLLGSGTGTFQPVVTYSTGAGSAPFGIAVADVNGDGRLDLLTANQGTSTAGVLLGSGNGTFQSVVTYSTGAGSTPNGIAVADVNGDGRPDVLTANRGTGTAGVLLGTGNGTFQPVVTYSTGSTSAPAGIAVADVNGDGELDLLTANAGSSTAGVLLGSGNGTFLPVVPYSTGDFSAPAAITVADVNGDGRPDLLTANRTGAGVLLGTGNGTFRPAVNYLTNLNRPSNSSDIAVADVNGDGWLDLLNTNTAFISTVSVLPGNGNGTFQTVRSYGAGSDPEAIAVADVNGDGRLDLLTANQGPNTAGVLLNTTLVGAPTITSLSLSVGPVGAPVTITGTNLASATGVRFNGTAATTFTVVNATTLTATVPAGATSGPVTVTTPAGTSNGVAFVVIAAPTVVTRAPTNIGPDATLGATLTSDGGLVSGATTFGFVYGQGPGTPTVNSFLGKRDQTVPAYSALPVSLISPAFGLTPSTTYTVRAFATNSVATSYGEAITFTTPPACVLPVITVPANQTLAADAGQCSATRTFAAAAPGTPAPVVSYVVNGLPITFPYAFPVGTTTVTAVATNCGGSATGTFTVTVQDQQAPTVRAAGFQTALVNGTRTIEAADVDGGSFDNCGIASLSISPRTFTCANLGPNPVTLTVTDNAGNVATQTVTVVIVDNTAPVVLAAGLQLNLVNGTRTIEAADLDYGSYDECGGLVSLTLSQTTFTCANVGPNPVTLTVRDQAGNVATQTVTVLIEGDATCSSSLASRAGNGPAKMSLSTENRLQAYPNPVTDQATVSFRPTQAGRAQVKVYNQLGVVVATLYDGVVEGNRLYRVSLNGQPLARGVYNCQLITNGQVTNQRLLVSK